MRCAEVRERFADGLAGTLDARTAEALRDHLSTCAECQAEVAGLDALWTALDRVAVPMVPSSRMRERFSTMVAAERALEEGRPASRPAGRRAWTLSSLSGGPFVQMALAASMLLVGVLIGRGWPAAQPVPPQAEIAEVRSELRDMRQMLTLSLLQQQSATERLRGVNWTAQIDRPGNEVVTALLDTLLHDPNVNVRLAAIDALRRFSDRAEVRSGAREAVHDRAAPLLQVAAIDFMVETRDPEAPALFRQLAADTTVDEAVRGRAQWGLGRISS